MRQFFSFIIALCMTSAAAFAAEAYTIYPVPHEQIVTDRQIAAFTKSVNIIAESGIDDITIHRVKQVLSEHGLQPIVAKSAAKSGSNVFLGINGSHGLADRQATMLKVDRKVFGLKKFDRHILSLTAQGGNAAQVVIVGENTDAVFCALASLEQMLDGGTQSMPCVTIFDYADIANRGIIEGYYGVPYTAQVTKDLFRFMARYKMNTYMYGAKSDAYHSRYWDAPYPTSLTPEQVRIGYLSQDMMRDITATAHACKVNFIWAIHPGKAFADPQQRNVNDRIMTKFESMHALGVRQFGVFVDDVGVPSERAIMDLCANNLSDLQHRIDARWNTPSAIPADTVKPLHYVPQLYAFSWVKPESRHTFFESLRNTPDKVNIYITGRDVWSVPNNADLDSVRGFLGRDVSWWWNYPCNDQDNSKLFVMDTYTNFRDETHILSLERLEPELKGANSVIINPMQQGELSKIALFSVADYTWNNCAFNNQRSWEAALPAVVGQRWAPALRKVAPYLRYYDSDALAYHIRNYKASVKRGDPRPGTLLNELNAVQEACNQLEKMVLSANEPDVLFYYDLRPWLKKLEHLTGEAIALLNGEDLPETDKSSQDDFTFEVLSGMGEHISLTTCTAEPSAECLPAFIAWLRQMRAEQTQN